MERLTAEFGPNGWVHALVTSAANEGGEHGIHVNGIALGVISTPMTAG